MVVRIDDIRSSDLLSRFEACCEFIDSARDKCSSVLVHCAAGVSRSASVVIGYVMYKKKISFNKAYQFVKARRKVISPNPGFVHQLKSWEKQLKQKNEKGCEVM